MDKCISIENVGTESRACSGWDEGHVCVSSANAIPTTSNAHISEVRSASGLPNSQPNRSGILVVDDHPLFREGVRALLAKQSELALCGEADTEQTAGQAIETLKPKLVLLGLRLHGEDTIELIARLHQQEPDLKILVFGQSDEMLLGESALRAGAQGLMLKNQAPGDLLSAIQTVLRGEIYLNDKLTSLILKKAYFGAQADEITRKLSHRELQVFTMIGLGYSTRDIATKLKLSRRTVNVHRENIKHKLSLRAAPDLVYAAITWMQNRSSASVAKAMQPSSAAA